MDRRIGYFPNVKKIKSDHIKIGNRIIDRKGLFLPRADAQLESFVKAGILVKDTSTPATLKEFLKPAEQPKIVQEAVVVAVETPVVVEEDPAVHEAKEREIAALKEALEAGNWQLVKRKAKEMDILFTNKTATIQAILDAVRNG